MENKVDYLMNAKYAEIEQHVLRAYKDVRVFKPGDPLGDFKYNPHRLNLKLDNNGVIYDLWFG